MFDFSGKPQNPSEWFGMAQKYLESLRTLAPTAAPTQPPFGWPSAPHGAPFPGMSPFPAGMFDGSRHTDVAERMLEGLRSYFAMIQSIATAGAPGVGEANPWSGMTSNWTDAMRQAGDAAVAGDNPLLRAFREFAGGGAQGLGLDPLGGQFANAPGGADLRALLQLPTFGMAREHQEQAQQGILALLDFQQKSQRYQALIGKAWQRGSQLFQQRLTAGNEATKPIETPRALYDAWVDAIEEGYAEIALSADFSQAYADYVNAQMKVRQHLQGDVERMTGQLGMPTRTEVNSIGRRLQEVRRELRAIREATAVSTTPAKELAALRNEVAALRRENEALRQSARPAEPVVPAAVETAIAVSQPGSVPNPRERPVAKRAAKRAPKVRHSATATPQVRVAPSTPATSPRRRASSPASSAARFAEAARTATQVKPADKPVRKDGGKR